jgi:hypothetical protein
LRNCQRLARERTFISHDAQYNAYEVWIDPNFLRKYEIFPHLYIACLQFGKLNVFFKINIVGSYCHARAC